MVFSLLFLFEPDKGFSMTGVDLAFFPLLFRVGSEYFTKKL